MPEIVNCPQCQRQLRVPEELLGKKVKCPSCGTTFTAASAAPSEPPPAPAEDEEAVSTSRKAAEDEYKMAPREEDSEVRPRRRRRREEESDDEPYGRSYGDLTPHRGALILTLSIIGFFCLGIVLGPIAWVMANNDLREMRAGRMDPSGEGLTNAGRIIGIIVTVLSALACLCFGIQFTIGFMQGIRGGGGRF